VAPVAAGASDDKTDESFFSKLPIETHGFYEVREGYRLQNDKYEKDMSIMENRLQLDLSSYLDWADLIFINDLFPKDWESFFIGRDTEYLKAPSDAAKISLFGDWASDGDRR
jgi:hypothetical protein